MPLSALAKGLGCWTDDCFLIGWHRKPHEVGALALRLHGGVVPDAQPPRFRFRPLASLHHHGTTRLGSLLRCLGSVVRPGRETESRRKTALLHRSSSPRQRTRRRSARADRILVALGDTHRG